MNVFIPGAVGALGSPCKFTLIAVELLIPTPMYVFTHGALGALGTHGRFNLTVAE